MTSVEYRANEDRAQQQKQQLASESHRRVVAVDLEDRERRVTATAIADTEAHATSSSARLARVEKERALAAENEKQLEVIRVRQVYLFTCFMIN